MITQPFIIIGSFGYYIIDAFQNQNRYILVIIATLIVIISHFHYHSSIWVRVRVRVRTRVRYNNATKLQMVKHLVKLQIKLKKLYNQSISNSNSTNNNSVLKKKFKKEDLNIFSTNANKKEGGSSSSLRTPS